MWSKLLEDMSQRDKVQRLYGNHQRLEFHKALQTPGGEGNQDKGEWNHHPSYRKTDVPKRAYSASFRITRSKPNQISSGFDHSGANRSVTKSHHSSKSQVVSRRRQGYKGKNKTPFNQRQRVPDPMIQKLFYLVKEVHKSHK
ncbi:hypothetical protein O181_026410 [Austropuccinia psidii MF-1]|uniref:Uncharacterized protein n=1 Tax=Austropuccinia psidii MF-1 TaxID=1389203 RepID=A0A9Q3CPB9_9BASI|nr:hypothetical protein [Austropuccinia psidii MF-1]